MRSELVAAQSRPQPDATQPLGQSSALRLPNMTRLLWPLVAGLALLGPLTAPLPTAWLGLGALAAVLIGHGRTLFHRGAGIPFWLAMLPYLAGALVGYAVTIRPETAEIR